MLERFICLGIGYLFGLFQTGYLLGKIKKKDIRKFGSGNTGATNTVRVFGLKMGSLVFLGDFLKALIACFIIRFGCKGFFGEASYLMMFYTGFGVILGHNFPFYLNFKGGKGIASMAGIIVCCFQWEIIVIDLILFTVLTLATGYVSLASLSITTIFFGAWLLLGNLGMLSMPEAYLPESYLIVGVITAMAFYRHRGNIVRLLHGEENKIFHKKK